MSSDTHNPTPNIKNTKQLNQFIKSDDRKGALNDLNKVLEKAAGEKK